MHTNKVTVIHIIKYVDYIIYYFLYDITLYKTLIWLYQGFPDGSAVKNPPAMKETQKMQVQFLGQEYPLEEGMTTHSSILAWRIPWTEEPGGLQSMESQRVRHN